MSVNTQRLTILAQDPSVRSKGALVLAQVDVPSESLAPGPMGWFAIFPSVHNGNFNFQALFGVHRILQPGARNGSTVVSSAL